MGPHQITPAQTALLNIDLQCCFVENSPVASPRGLAVLDKVNRVTDACRAAGVMVIHTRHVVRDDHSNIGQLDALPPVRGGVIDDGAESSQLHPGLTVQPGDTILRKPKFGAFHGTDLEIILRSRGIDTVIVQGLTTNHCCEMTTREANARDFKVLFLSDATATFDHPHATAEQIQKATLATVGFAHAEVLDSYALLERLAPLTGSAAHAA